MEHVEEEDGAEDAGDEEADDAHDGGAVPVRLRVGVDDDGGANDERRHDDGGGEAVEDAVEHAVHVLEVLDVDLQGEPSLLELLGEGADGGGRLVEKQRHLAGVLLQAADDGLRAQTPDEGPLDIGRHALHELEVGVELSAKIVGDAHGLEEEVELRLETQVLAAAEVIDLDERVGDADAGEPLGQVHLGEVA